MNLLMWETPKKNFYLSIKIIDRQQNKLLTLEAWEENLSGMPILQAECGHGAALLYHKKASTR